jgi:hypothetical protein
MNVYSFTIISFMKNNTSFADTIEAIILSDKLKEASAALLRFLTQYNAKNNAPIAQDLQQQVVDIREKLVVLNNRLQHNSITEMEAAAIEKNIWVALHHINNQVRNLDNFDASKSELQTESVFTYAPEKQTWRDAGWLPLLVAAGVIAVAFSIGLYYNSNRISAKKAADQAAVDAKNGISGRITEGPGALKLLEEKTISGMDGAVLMTIKKAVATDSTLELTIKTQNTSKDILRDLDFSLINIEQNGNKTKMSDDAKALGDIPIDLGKNVGTEKHVHFNFGVGEYRNFLLYCAFHTPETPIEKSLGIPFTLR